MLTALPALRQAIATQEYVARLIERAVGGVIDVAIGDRESCAVLVEFENGRSQGGSDVSAGHAAGQIRAVGTVPEVQTQASIHCDTYFCIQGLTVKNTKNDKFMKFSVRKVRSLAPKQGEPPM
jgi:hypothetical protein